MRRTPVRTVLLVLLLLLLPSARPALLILLLPILLPPLLLRQLVADQPFEEVQAVAVWVKLKSLAARVVGGLQAGRGREAGRRREAGWTGHGAGRALQGSPASTPAQPPCTGLKQTVSHRLPLRNVSSPAGNHAG